MLNIVIDTCGSNNSACFFSDAFDFIIKFKWRLWSLNKLLNHLWVDVVACLLGDVDSEGSDLLVNDIFVFANDLQHTNHLLFT